MIEDQVVKLAVYGVVFTSMLMTRTGFNNIIIILYTTP